MPLIALVDKDIDVLTILSLHYIPDNPLLVMDIQLPAVLSTNKAWVLLFLNVLVPKNRFIKVLLRLVACDHLTLSTMSSQLIIPYS
jgi:hypothetical protein